jgi:hypothetical protein
MSAVLDELEPRIRALDTDDRLALLRTLIADLDGRPEADVESAWLDEARRRDRGRCCATSPR